MAWASSAVVAAELRMLQSRRKLRHGLRRLRCRLSQPPLIVAAAAAAALLGFSLARGNRVRAVAGALATALVRHVAGRLMSARLPRASTPAAARPTPSA